MSRVTALAALLAITLLPSAARAEGGAYVPPDNGVAGLMSGTGGDNGYGLGALMAQQGPASPPAGGDGKKTLAGAPAGGTGASSPSAVAARKAMRAENRQLKARVASLSAKVDVLTRQLAGAEDRQSAARGPLMALTAERDRLKQSLSDSQAKLTALQKQLGSVEVQLADSLAVKSEETQVVQALRERMAAGDKARAQLEEALKESRGQLAQANERASQAGRAQAVPLDSDVRREAYVVGQAMAAGLRDKLAGYAATGVGLDLNRVKAGLTDGLQEKMKLSRSDMDRYWQSFADRLNRQVASQLKAAERLIAGKVKGTRPDLVADGITYVVTKKGKVIKDDATPVSLSLKERVVDGKVISEVASLTLAPDDDMPGVVRNALPLLGEGAEVTAWAPAKVVYGDRALPPGVMPFTVLEYRLRGLVVKSG